MAKNPNLIYRVLEDGFEVDSPESIAKWRESRKRKFPTPSNIQQKAIDQLETVGRGEKFVPKRLGTRLFRHPIKDEKNDRRQHHRPQFSFHNPSSSWINHRLPAINTSQVVVLESYFDTVEIDPEGILVKKLELSWNPSLTKEVTTEEEEPSYLTSAVSGVPPTSPEITDEDEVDGDPPPISIQESVITTEVSTPVIGTPAGLAALAGYGTDSEIEDGEIQDSSEQIGAVAVTPKPAVPPSIEPAPSQTQTSNNGHSNQNRIKRTRRKKNQRGDCQRLPGPKRPFPVRLRRTDHESSLLGRLLDDDMCQERNAVLVVNRFLVQHNFLKGMEQSEDMTQELIDCIRNAHKEAEQD